MSRSFRKPWATDGFRGSKRKQFLKRYANKTIRNSRDVPNGKAYRKFFESWDISDYNFWINLKKEDRPWKYNRK